MGVMKDVPGQVRVVDIEDEWSHDFMDLSRDCAKKLMCMVLWVGQDHMQL